jgi:hypothetical protein
LIAPTCVHALTADLAADMSCVAAEEDRTVTDVGGMPMADPEGREPCRVEQPDGFSHVMTQERLELSERCPLHCLVGHGDLVHRDQAPALIREGEDGQEMVGLDVDGGFVGREGRRLDPYVGEDPFFFVPATHERYASQLAHRTMGAIVPARISGPRLLELPIAMPENDHHPVGLSLEADELDLPLDLTAERSQVVAE